MEEGWDFIDEHLLPDPAQRDWMEARDAVLPILEAGAHPADAVTLIMVGHPPRPMPLDPSVIAAELGAARDDSGQVPDWRLE